MLLKINLLFFHNKGSVDDRNFSPIKICHQNLCLISPAAFLFSSFFLWQKKRDYVIRETITKYLFPGVEQ